ncbi:MAG TPA: tetratricopeptide repeat protein [Mariprofundaceae bacterium]|nr:tetratricopeptide repeat protein [Mariprofundaceae bacterium]
MTEHHDKAIIRIACAAIGLAMLAGCAAQHQPAAETKPGVPEHPANLGHSLTNYDPAFLYLAAQNALKEGQPSLAVQMLEALVAKDNSAIDPHLQLVQLLLQYNQLDKAKVHIEQLRSAHNLDPAQRQQLDLFRIRLAYGQGKPDIALGMLDDFLSRQPKDIQALELKVQLLAEQKRLPEAVRVIKKAIHLQDTPQLRLLQAQILMQQDQIEGAKLALQHMRELDPDDDTPVLMLANIALKQNHPDEAEALLRAFLADHPESLRVSNALGRVMVQQNRLVEAILIYRDLDSRTGGEPSVLQALGLLYYQHKDFSNSATTFRKLISLQPSDEAFYYLGASLEAMKKYPQARKTYANIGKDAPIYTETQLRLAGLDIMDNNMEQAVKRLQQVIRKHPEQLVAYTMLSSIRVARKEYRKALDETANTLAIRKLPPQLLFNRAVALEHFKKYADVEITLKRVLEHDSRHVDSLNFLAYTYAVQGIHLDEAESLVRRALDLKPDDGYFLDSLAWIQFKKGQIKMAIATQKKALKLVGDDAVMREHMGDMLWKNGQYDEARKEWQQAIKFKHEDPAMLRKKITQGLE